MSNIEGIRDLPTLANVNKGELQPPADFDNKKFVGRWAKKGTGVEKSKREQPLGRGKVADGWTVYKNGRGQICQKTLSSGVYVFMVRPKGLQKAINASFGNVSKERVVGEHKGETVEGQPLAFTGMLTDAVLNKVPGFREDHEELHVPMNRIQEPEAASAARATTKPKKFSLK